MTAAAADERLLEIGTTHGAIRGRALARGVRAYLGIPYAAPPLGPQRFRPPVAAARWSGVRDATRFGPASAQYFDPLEAPLEELLDPPYPDHVPRWVGSEDSLTLNVWTAAAAGDRRPVVVWIHGGANWLESSRLAVYHGEALAQAGVVFVSLNYRLGVFGFADLSALGDERLAGSHSHGLLDQLAAVDWVLDNVAAFGGDPANITLAGESAGSMDISWLIASGRLAGRVRRAVLMSGVAGVPGLATSADYCWYSEHEGRRQARQLFERLHVRTVGDLEALSTGELLGRLAQLVPSQHMLFYWDSLFYPRLGAFASATPFDAIRAGAARGIDLMVGSTAYEMGLWLQWDDTLDARAAESLARELPGVPSSAVPAMGAAYERWFGHGGAGAPGLHLLGDAMFVMPALAVAALQARAGGRAYAYQFTWEHRDSRLRALHAADVGFFLGTWRTPGAEAVIGEPVDAAECAEREALSAQMLRSLVDFATTGDPTPRAPDSQRERWLPYSIELRPLMQFGVTPHVAFDPLLARRSWWQQHVYGPVLPGVP